MRWRKKNKFWKKKFLFYYLDKVLKFFLMKDVNFPYKKLMLKKKMMNLLVLEMNYSN